MHFITNFVPHTTLHRLDRNMVQPRRRTTHVLEYMYTTVAEGVCPRIEV